MKDLELPRLDANPGSPFPPTATALQQPNGLLAWGGDLQPERLLRAYRQGIFPWYTEGEPILWWSPSPRCVIFPASVHLSRRTRRRYHSGDYRITADTAFREVIQACAEPREADSGTWITPDMQGAYLDLHQNGYAHSVELWRENELLGGIYGIALGSVFFGESMFSRETDASKIALTALCHQLTAWDFALLDCQVPNPHLRSLGAVRISRTEFEAHLRTPARTEQRPGLWTDRFSTNARW